ncbi:hypothetical protein Hdeb2414_s0008g00265011 [Helianthus debilis subsp. tardiflorus]
MSLNHFCQSSSYINVFFFSFLPSYLHSRVLCFCIFQTTLSMYLSLKSPLINTRHLFIKEKIKPKLSLTHFQNEFWGYFVCLDDDDDDDDCSIVVPTERKKLSASAVSRFLRLQIFVLHIIVPTSLFQHR